MVGMTGREIYDDFTNGVGPASLSDAAVMVNEVAAKYGERAGRARSLIARMDAAWQGEAAGAARRGFGPVEVEHGLAGDALVTAQDLSNRQAGSFGDARNAVVPVPPEPVMPDPWAMLTTQGVARSYREQLADYNAASQHNVDVMSGYTDASVYNANGMPRAYGVLAADQAGMVIDSGTSDSSGPKSGDGTPVGGRGGGEWAGRGGGWEAPPSNAGGPAGSDGGAPAAGDGSEPVAQETTPGASVPGGPATRVPVDTGGGSGPLAGGPGGGWLPGPGPVGGGGPSDGSGGRRAAGPESGGGRGPGGPGGRGSGGSGSGPEVRGPGGRAGGEPHGPGGRVGAGPLASGPTGEAHGGRGGAGAGRGGALGGMPFAGGGRPRGVEDVERKAPPYLREDDPEGLLGSDELAAPPVIGEEDPESDEPVRAG